MFTSAAPDVVSIHVQVLRNKDNMALEPQLWSSAKRDSVRITGNIEKYQIQQLMNWVDPFQTTYTGWEWLGRYD